MLADGAAGGKRTDCVGAFVKGDNVAWIEPAADRCGADGDSFRSDPLRLARIRLGIETDFSPRSTPSSANCERRDHRVRELPLLWRQGGDRMPRVSSEPSATY